MMINLIILLFSCNQHLIYPPVSKEILFLKLVRIKSGYTSHYYRKITLTESAELIAALTVVIGTLDAFAI